MVRDALRRAGACSIVVLSLLIAAPAGAQSAPQKPAATQKPAVTASPESQKCIDCHKRTTPGIVAQWRGSRHAREGVGCFECHSASEKEPGAFAHEGETIATVLTPNACSGCHGEIVAENQRSHHAQAAKFIGSLDNVLGEVVEGRLAA